MIPRCLWKKRAVAVVPKREKEFIVSGRSPAMKKKEKEK